MKNNIEVGTFRFKVPIQINKFAFEKVGKLDEKPKKIIQNIGTLDVQDKSAVYTVQLEVGLQVGENKYKLFIVEAILVCVIEFTTSNKENERCLNNAVAILYSYLCLLVTQMIAMAKLPPLNFDDIKVKVERKVKSLYIRLN